MKISVIGCGYVGLVSGVCFADSGHTVTCIDNDNKKIQLLKDNQVPIYEPGLENLVKKNKDANRLTFSIDVKKNIADADVVFIAVGTPARRGDGHADLSYIYEAAEEIAKNLIGYTLIVTKSTVPVGTGNEIKNIITALGVKFGTEEDSKALDTEKLRYHKIVIMTDADIDGSHIRTLILTFFFRYMRELIELGHVYIATPPLYLVKKGSKKDYAWSDDQRDNLMKEYGQGTSIQRYKGLGEMNHEQLWDTTMNPQQRTLRRVSIENPGEADRVFSMLMGDEVPPRREFIENNAIYANIDA